MPHYYAEVPELLNKVKFFSAVSMPTKLVKLGIVLYNTYYSVRKESDLILFCENLVDFNEVRLHEATFNLPTHA